MKREIIKTLDGSTTIQLTEWNECYHSKHGAIQEAQHVFIKNGLSLFENKHVSILEIGFGTGLNAFITLLEAKKMQQTIDYVGVEAYPISAAEVLDIAMSGTSATLLARRWESALLVNVDNATLARLMNNQDALDALMSIEGFRNLNQDIETIINKSEFVKKAKKEKNDEEMKEFIATHLFERSFYYNQAQHKVTVDHKTVDAVVLEIMSVLA